MEEVERANGPPREVTLLAGIHRDLQAEVAQRATTIELPAGEWLLRRGDTGDRKYVVLAGRLEVLRDSPVPVVLRLAGAGDAVGERPESSVTAKVTV